MRWFHPCWPTVLVMACSTTPSEPRCRTTVLPNCSAVGATDRYGDEACQALDDAERRMSPIIDPARAPTIDEPAEGAVLNPSPPATFRWSGGLATVPWQRDRDPRSWRLATWRDELSRWTTLIPEAHAHCPPFTGIGYALTFRSADGRTILRVEQSARAYTPSTEAWSVLLGSARQRPGPIELTILATRFRENEVIEGPFAPAAPRRFFIAIPR